MKQKAWWVSCIAAIAVPSIIYAGNLTLPHLFSAGTPILASDMNENFDAVKQAIARTSSSGTRLHAIGMKSSDGLSIPFGFAGEGTIWDSTELTACSLAQVVNAQSQVEYRCLPATSGAGNNGAVAAVFLDAACTQKAITYNPAQQFGTTPNAFATLSTGATTFEVRAAAAPVQAQGYYGPSLCSPVNCGGCCDANGACNSGNTTTLCGASGNICQNCGANACTSGTCVGGGTPVGSACEYHPGAVQLQTLGAVEPFSSFALVTFGIL
jgi:hypothetical protein